MGWNWSLFFASWAFGTVLGLLVWCRWLEGEVRRLSDRAVLLRRDLERQQHELRTLARLTGQDWPARRAVSPPQDWSLVD